MSATPSDIAKYTSDGVLITSEDLNVQVVYPDAIDGSDNEIEMFYDLASDCQFMLDEKFTLLSYLAPPHEGIEVEESIGIGTTIPIAPVIPSFFCIDDERDMAESLRCAGFAHEMGSDRYSVELRK